ncbi:MAG: glycosyltransferase [Sideroxydans sp.]|nr:glycosyltransferase [Sideroxydans sp.]
MLIPIKIVIGIPTFRRPQGLRRLLSSISEQKISIPLCVLVADNEGEGGQGIQLVNQLNREGYSCELRSIAVEERGLSHVRNALLKTAFNEMSADVLLMVDDDVRVNDGWASALIEMQQREGADVVAGSVFAEFETTPPNWVYGQSVYWGQIYPAGIVDMVSGTTNVLITKNMFAKFGEPLFDVGFSLTGGEDKEYFLRIKELGARFAFTPDGHAYELVGPSRMTKRWAWDRAYRTGNTDIRIFKRYQHSAMAWMAEISKIVLAILLSIIRVPLCIFHPARRMKHLLTVARQFGKIAALFDYHPDTYKVTHGK